MRNYLGKGYYSGDKIWDANVTLIEQEAFDAASEVADDPYETDCLRRNIVTQNVDLTRLLNVDFSIGLAGLRGWKLRPLCKYIESLNPNRGVLKKLAKSAGIGAKVIQTGHFRVGDTIEVVTDS